jgi:hypothetical protein
MSHGAFQFYGRSMPMRNFKATALHDEIDRRVVLSIYEFGMVNIPVIAGKISKRYDVKNLVDIEHLVLGYAQFYNAAIVFDRSPEALESPVGDDNDGMLLQFVDAKVEPLGN